MFRRIGAIEAAREHRHRAGRKARAMRLGINAARKAGNDGVARRSEICRETARDFRPSAEALRDPTMPIVGLSRQASEPRSAITGGGAAISRNKAG